MEQTVKKREWVKTAAIIFLAVLLVLTFFSNTIMNRALPEVMTRYAESGTIDSKIRITGTVSAKENYDVILEQSYKVASVAVKVGQEVSTGDVLFTLEPGESDELSQAQAELRSLERSYRQQLLSGDSADYTREEREIRNAEAALEEARAALAKLTDVSQSELDAAAEAVTKAQAAVDAAARAVKEAQTGVERTSEGSGDGSIPSSYRTAVTEAENAKSAADNNRKAAYRMYDADYQLLVTAAKARIASDYNAAHPLPETQFEALTEAEQNTEYSRLLPYYLEMLAAELSPTDPQAVAYSKIMAAESAYDSAAAALSAAQAALSDAYDNVNYTPATYYNGKSHSEYLKALDEAQIALDEAEDALESATAAQTRLTERKAAYTAAKQAEKAAAETLEDLEFNLAEQKKADGKTQQMEALQLEELQEQIAEKKKLIESLSAETATEVKAKVNGKIASLSVSAGHKAEAGAVLATIEVPDLGYSLNTTLTADQARLLHVGDSAAVSNYYWGSKTTATIASISPDPKDPRNSKLVVFDVTGDVDNGDSLTFSIGEKNATYDLIVPNSAVRSDTNGSFVLIITAKNSPLGNRYFATRVDVEVLASDDKNSAVKGALNNMDSVITTSSNNAPVSNGDQVRLSDDNMS